MNTFLAVYKLRSFSKAAVELGISTSALSHAIRNLETRLGIRLLHRTTRTVAPTDAGSSLAKRLEIGFEEIGGALDEVNQHRDRPAGRIRINVLSDGARLLIAKHMPQFLKAYPEVDVEIAVNDQMIDIVAAGFDAGIRFGGTVPEDFVAIRLGRPLRWVAVASPRYINQHPPVSTPADLKSQECIQIRTGNGVVYRWEFEQGQERVAVEVPGQLCVNETTLGVELALNHVGIFYCLEERVTPWLQTGELQVVLPDWSPIEPAFYIYFPGHRMVPPGLTELIEFLKRPE
ncbi:LysR family transcriptional regulator [Bordetella genomosp. 5]|uniref:LysR family transcriptional regulator n=1 Tax=Bordetella genomosp. 5 TaxID=1395608 RepID=UPI001BAEB187|nr:LysR family transcriptional regulator [Bordetella genomosp. 5]